MRGQNESPNLEELGWTERLTGHAGLMVWPRAGLVVAAEAAIGGGTAASGRTVDNVVELTAEVTGAKRIVGTFRTFAGVAKSTTAGIEYGNISSDIMVGKRVKADGNMSDRV